jgi:stringent starvation protein B
VHKTTDTLLPPISAYNLISNNCQNFAVEMLKAIQIGAHREFGTTFAVYQRATGEGAIMDLFADEPDRDPAALQQDAANVSKPQRQNAVKHAQQVMDDNTTKMDDDGDGKPDEGGWVSRIRRLRD